MTWFAFTGPPAPATARVHATPQRPIQASWAGGVQTVSEARPRMALECGECGEPRDTGAAGGR
eukprot:2989815-Pyramimonas_sp.AAC.1